MEEASFSNKNKLSTWEMGGGGGCWRLRSASETRRVRGLRRLRETPSQENERKTITDILVKEQGRHFAYEKALSLKRVGLTTVA